MMAKSASTTPADRPVRERLQDPSLLETRAFVGGWIESDSGGTFAVEDPATGQTIAQVAACGKQETLRAIECAHEAFGPWRARSAKDRAHILRAWRDLIIANIEDLAQILTAECGKPLAEARAEIAYGAAYVEWFAEEAKRIYGETIPAPGADRRIIVLREPIGVVACITPWNFPNAMLTRKLAPALATGCTLVCKPANETPLSALALVKLAERAGVPIGAINMVFGDTVAIGQALTQSALVRKLSFTGSTAVGRMLLAACAPTVKRTSMELGGNAPLLVFDDADLDRGVAGAMASKFRNAGQTCICANRMLVQAGIAPVFIARLEEAISALKLGRGSQEGATIGPLIHAQAADKVMGLLDDAVAAGATVRLGGRRRVDLGPSFVEPTLLTDVTNSMAIAREEIFGPIAAVQVFKTEAEAVARANDTASGLAAYVYTTDASRQWRLSETLRVGMIGVNETMLSNEAAPFGGVKESGHGREGSRHGLEDYLEFKYLCIGGIADDRSR